MKHSMLKMLKSPILKYSLILSAGLALSGCATGCYKACVFGFGPGNPVFNTVADVADRDDQCQTRTHSTLTGARLKPDNHVPPDFCKFRGRNKGYDVYDRTGRRIGEVRSRQ